MIKFAVYIGIGALLHSMFVGPHFDWSSATTIGWVFGWPIMLIIGFWAVMLAIALIVAVVCCLYWWLDAFANWRARRRTLKANRARQ